MNQPFPTEPLSVRVPLRVGLGLGGTKEKLIQVINNMPDKFSIDDIIEEFVLLSKIEHGLADVEAGRVYSEDQVAEKMEKWLR